MRKSLHAFRKYCLPFIFLLTLILGGSLQGMGQIAQRGSATSATTTGTTLAINKPTGVVAGDVMIVNIAQYSTSNVILSNPTLNGWTLIAGADLEGNRGRWGTVLYKIAGASEPTNYVFTLATQTSSSVGAIVAFSGVNIANPFDALGSITVRNQANLQATEITTNTANAAVIMFGMVGDNDLNFSNWNTTSPGALTELYDTNISGGQVSIGAAWAIKVTAGATGNGVATVSSSRNGSILIALKPLPSVSFTTSSQSSSAETGTMIVTALLSSASASTVTVPYTVTGTATNGTDYSISSNPIIIPAGSTTGTATITITPDNIYEGNETVILTMGTPTNAIPGSTTVHTATITDDDPAQDSDADGVPDYLDQDDDNDGVTDCAEKGLDALTVGNAFLISGNASTVSSNEIRLTPNLGYQIGTAMYSNKIDFSSSFNFSFEAYLGNNDAGADGIAIIFHNDPRGASAIGASGEGMGASGIQNGIALEMDTYQNTNQGDPTADHGCIWETVDISNRLTTPIPLPNLENGAWHTVNVNWIASSKTISYKVDGVTAGQYTGDLITNFFAGSSAVYFGFSAATGGSINVQSVRFSNLCDLPAIVDNDHDGIPDNLDLDSDGDGCFDAKEAGFTADQNGHLVGTGVDANGLVTGSSSGYTTPADRDGNSVFDFQQAGIAPAIRTQPANRSICASSSTTFAVVASDANTYQWQVSTNSGGLWTNLTNTGIYSGVTTATLTLTNVPVSPYNGYWYRVIVSNNSYACAVLTSNIATLVVSGGTPTVPGTISGTTTQCSGLTNQIYSIVPVSGATTYNWAVPTGWTITSGQNTTSINVTTGAVGNNGNITVTAGNSCGTSSASSLAVTVNPNLPASVRISASATTICGGTSVTFTATPTNGGTAPTYQWYKGAIALSGETNPTYTSATLANNDQISCVMTSNATPCLTGNPATSNVITIVVTPNNTITLSSGAGTDSQTKCINTAITNITYSTTGATGISNDGVSGANSLPAGVKASWASNQLKISGTPIEIGTFNYSIPLTGGCGNVNATGTITVNSSTAITSQSTDGQTQCINGTFTDISVTSSETGTLSYQWYSNTVAENTGGSLISGATSASYTPLATTAGTLYYYCIVTGTCGTATSAVSGAFVVNPNLPVSVSIVSSSSLVCQGSNVTFTATPNNGGTYPFYQWKVNGENSGTNNSSFAYSPANSDVITCELTSDLSCVVSATATSNAISMTVVPSPTSLAGSNVSTCASSPVNITAGASATNYSEIAWTSNGSGTFTDASSLTTCSYTPSAADIAAGSVLLTLTAKANGNCADVISTKVLTINPLAAVFNVTGGGYYCSGGSGVEVGLSSSETGVSYQLYKNGTSTGSPIAGTGLAISFGNQTAGTYTVKATNSTTSCTQDMNGSVVVTDTDTEKPTISSCPDNRTVACSTDLPVVKTIAEFKAAGGRVSDNCTVEENLKLSSSDVFDLNGGCRVTRTYTIKDEAGNQATCTQVFTITDVAKPVITCNPDLASTPNTEGCAAILTITAPTAISENCSLVNISPTYSYRLGNDPSATPVTGTGNFTATFPEGNTTISWVITDLCGNTSTPCAQIIHVRFNLTTISYDNGSTETGSGSGIQPIQTSTHEYFVDDKSPDPDYTYSWVLYENNGGSPGAEVSSSLYAINPVSQADIKLTFKSDIPTRNYILSVIKTQSSTLCKKQENLIVKVLKNTFDTELKPFYDHCQAGETGTPSTILWEVTFSGGGVAPYSLNYAVNLTDESNNQIKACTGTVSNITLTGTTPDLDHQSGCDTSTMPYMRVEKTATNSYKVLLKYTMSSVTAKNFKASIQIDATDQFSVSEIGPGNNSETLQLHGVPDTSPITTD